MSGVDLRKETVHVHLASQSTESLGDFLSATFIVPVNRWIGSPGRANYLCNGSRTDMGIGK
jgi:hypothetical protein